ncbi:hypothetical protein B0H11DRAFT_156224 [Mycena galericulata]|nr:hypothetical protein B0H11DRAFT_156224 [Mycena galericulata]
MIGPRSLLLLFAVLLFAFLVTASPVANEGGMVKKALKQYKAKRGEPPTRVARDASYPSGYYAAPGLGKRDGAGYPTPSKYAPWSALFPPKRVLTTCFIAEYTNTRLIRKPSSDITSSL